MIFMNEWEIDNAYAEPYLEERPNLDHAVTTLYMLCQWTNRNSDGWAYWPKPCRAAAKLQALIQPRLGNPGMFDISDAELKAALTPIKAFLTRQGVNHGEVLP